MNPLMTFVASPVCRHHLLLGIWRLCDPKISLASIASMVLGACIAAGIQPLDWQVFWLTVAGVLLIEAAKNASGEVVDYDSGADLLVRPVDRSPFSGGKRVIVDGLLTRHQTIVVGALFYALGIGIGLWIAMTLQPWVLAFGLAGMFLAYFYHGAPIRLAYHGLGEAAVALAYGPVICCGTVFVQLGRVPHQAILLSLPLGLLIAAFLVINEFPDRHADAGARKRNLVVRLGKQRATLLLMSLQAVAFIGIAVMPYYQMPPGILLGLIGLPSAIMSSNQLQAATTTPEIIPAQRTALLSFLLTAVGLGIGWLLL